MSGRAAETATPPNPLQVAMECLVWVAGEVRLRTPDGERSYTAGESFFVPEGVTHGAVVSAGYRSVVFFDQADRYRART